MELQSIGLWLMEIIDQTTPCPNDGTAVPSTKVLCPECGERIGA